MLQDLLSKEELQKFNSTKSVALCHEEAVRMNSLLTEATEYPWLANEYRLEELNSDALEELIERAFRVKKDMEKFVWK